MADSDDPRLDEEITGGEAAKILGLSRQRVNRLAHDQKLKGRYIANRYWVFTRRDVLAFKDQPKNPGGRPKSHALIPTPVIRMAA